LSQELTTISPAPSGLIITEQERAELQEAYASNISGGQMSVFHLDRIKIINGPPPMWSVPTLGEAMPLPRLDGIILGSRDIRAYYKDKDAGNVPPDCSSNDCETGHGKPGGKCKECSLAEWDSADGESSAQACKQMRLLLFLYGTSKVPDVVNLPPTSVRASINYFYKLFKEGIPKHSVITSIGLEKAQSKAGKAYGKATFTFLRRLSPEEQSLAAERAAMFEAMLRTEK
jgi:hypothetical protein